MFRVVIVVACLCAQALAMKSTVDVIRDLNATEFLKIAQQLNDTRILGGDAEGPYTILVPADSAFAKLSQAELNNLANSPGLLEEVVGVHIIKGELFSWDLTNGRVVVSDNGHFIRVYSPNGDSLYVNSAKVIKADIEANGAVIHLINSVLDAPEGTVYEVLRNPDYSLSMLADLVDKAGLNNTLHRTAGPYTVFAPSQGAFDRLSDSIKDQLLRSRQLLQQVISYHVHSGTLHLRSLDRNGTLSTLYRGHNIGVQVTDDIKLNGVASLEEVDIDCDNGVIHIIDHVLLPSTFGAVIG